MFERIFKIYADKLEGATLRIEKSQRLFQFEAIPALRPLCFQAVRLALVRIFHNDLGRFWHNPPGIALCTPPNEDQ